MIDLALKLGGAGVGLLSGLLGNNNELKRKEEEYNRKAYGSLMNAQERSLNLSPEATRRAAASELSTAQSAAVDNAMNQVAAGTANQGGNTIGGQASLAGSTAAMAAATPYAQQAAALHNQALGAEQQNIAQQESLGNSIANLSNHVSYLKEQANNPLKSALEGAVAGLTGGASMFNMLEPETQNTSISTGTDTPPQQVQTGPAQEPINLGGPRSGGALPQLNPMQMQAPSNPPTALTPGGLPLPAKAPKIEDLLGLGTNSVKAFQTLFSRTM